MNNNKDQLKYKKKGSGFPINKVIFSDWDDKLKINYGSAGMNDISFDLEKTSIAKEFSKRVLWNGKPLVGFFGRFRMEEELTEMLIPIVEQEMRGLNG